MNEIWKPNVTVASVIERNGRYLFVEEHTNHGLRLNQPAGHLDPGESIINGAIRETLEETACTFTPTGLLGVYLSSSNTSTAARRLDRCVTYLRFAFVGNVGEPIVGRTLDTGIVRTVWLTLDELRAERERVRNPLVLRCVEDRASGKPITSLDVLYTEDSIFDQSNPNSNAN